MRVSLLALALVSGLALGGCRKRGPVDVAALPDTIQGVEIASGVVFQSIPLPNGGKLWVYVPAVPAIRLSTVNKPCVLVAPAGSRLFHGMTLGDADRPEHLPYAQRGFVVVAYEIDGALPEGREPGDAEIAQAQKAFVAARCGLDNARVAADYALKRLKVDPERLYVAGHSSAATLALEAAVDDPRIQACAAFAPCTDVVDHFGPMLPTLEMLTKGASRAYQDISPLSNAGKRICPTLIVHARDDSVVPVAQSETFVARVKSAGGTIKLITPDRGDHHDAMLYTGIPAAIRWFESKP